MSTCGRLLLLFTRTPPRVNREFRRMVDGGATHPEANSRALNAATSDLVCASASADTTASAELTCLSSVSSSFGLRERQRETERANLCVCESV